MAQLEREETDPDESVRGLETLRELERIIAFTDAVIAVAITLLILPLMDFAKSEADSGKDFFRKRVRARRLVTAFTCRSTPSTSTPSPRLI